MFNAPIRHTRLSTLEEVMNFSYRTDFRATPMAKWQNNGQIAHADQYGVIYVTPYRREIHSILENAGYKDGSLYVPFSSGSETLPDEYQWLVRVAEEENWASTYEEAFQKASSRGIQPVKVSGKYQIREISRMFDDTEHHTFYFPMTMMFLANNTDKNIGTYIIIDEKSVMLCDEYGRTFLVKVKTVINDFINSLIAAGYTRTIHPWFYVRKVEAELPVE